MTRAVMGGGAQIKKVVGRSARTLRDDLVTFDCVAEVEVFGKTLAISSIHLQAAKYHISSSSVGRVTA